MELRDYQKRVTTGERIKEKRKELGITAEELGEKVGVNRSTIYRYEKGDIEKLPISVIEKIAKTLCIEPSYLIGYDALSMKKCSISPANETGTRDCVLLSEEEKSVILAFRAQPEMRKAIFRILKIKHSEQI